MAFSGTAMVLLAIPGPSVLFVVTRGVALGRRAALATVMGNELGLACHVVAVAVGVGAVVQRSLIVFTLMKLAGAAYLVWLGLGAIAGAGDCARRWHRPAANSPGGDSSGTASSSASAIRKRRCSSSRCSHSSSSRHAAT